MVFENGVVRKMFGPKRDNVAGDWKKLHEVEIHDLCSPPDIMRFSNLEI
jgi:hypothetical protein